MQHTPRRPLILSLFVAALAGCASTNRENHPDAGASAQPEITHSAAWRSSPGMRTYRVYGNRVVAMFDDNTCVTITQRFERDMSQREDVPDDVVRESVRRVSRADAREIGRVLREMMERVDREESFGVPDGRTEFVDIAVAGDKAGMYWKPLDNAGTAWRPELVQRSQALQKYFEEQFGAIESVAAPGEPITGAAADAAIASVREALRVRVMEPREPADLD